MHINFEMKKHCLLIANISHLNLEFLILALIQILYSKIDILALVSIYVNKLPTMASPWYSEIKNIYISS
jgi:hypothetical protein